MLILNTEMEKRRGDVEATVWVGVVVVKLVDGWWVGGREGCLQREVCWNWYPLPIIVDGQRVACWAYDFM